MKTALARFKAGIHQLEEEYLFECGWSLLEAILDGEKMWTPTPSGLHYHQSDAVEWQRYLDEK